MKTSIDEQGVEWRVACERMVQEKIQVADILKRVAKKLAEEENMTDDEIRIAVAESVGHDLHVIIKHNFYYRPKAKGYTSSMEEAWKLPKDEAQKYEAYVDRDDVPWCDKVFIRPAPPPDYPNDLNAMHEVEKELREPQVIDYILKLREVVEQVQDSGENGIEMTMVHATARQRCEAYLRTVGKWRE